MPTDSDVQFKILQVISVDGSILTGSVIRLDGQNVATFQVMESWSTVGAAQ